MTAKIQVEVTVSKDTVKAQQEATKAERALRKLIANLTIDQLDKVANAAADPVKKWAALSRL